MSPARLDEAFRYPFRTSNEKISEESDDSAAADYKIVIHKMSSLDLTRNRAPLGAVEDRTGTEDSS
jgi:hypothetical protein